MVYVQSLLNLVAPSLPDDDKLTKFAMLMMFMLKIRWSRSTIPLAQESAETMVWMCVNQF